MWAPSPRKRPLGWADAVWWRGDGAGRGVLLWGSMRFDSIKSLRRRLLVQRGKQTRRTACRRVRRVHGARGEHATKCDEEEQTCVPRSYLFLIRS